MCEIYQDECSRRGRLLDRVGASQQSPNSFAVQVDPIMWREREREKKLLANERTNPPPLPYMSNLCITQCDPKVVQLTACKKRFREGHGTCDGVLSELCRNVALEQHSAEHDALEW